MSMLLQLYVLACTGRRAPDTEVAPEVGDSQLETAQPDTDTGEGVEVGDLSFERRPKNLLLIGIDTLRRDALGRYGGGPDTPFLDGLFEQGVALDQHRSCSNYTFLSLVCTLTGRDGIDAGFVPLENESIPGDLPLLAGVLADAGYARSLIYTNGFFAPTIGIPLDYDHVAEPDDLEANEVVALGLEHLDDMMTGSEPWFLHLHFMDPHLPYDPPEGYADTSNLGPIDWDFRTANHHVTGEIGDLWDDLEEEDQALVLAWAETLYAGEVRWLDDQIQELFGELESRGALDDTLVVIASDHGEAFFEHGEGAHGQTIYTGENAAAAAFWTKDAASGGPGLKPLAHTGLTTLEDLLPTTLAALGIAAPATTGLLVGDAPDDRLLLPFRAMKSGLTPSRIMIVGERSGSRLHYWTDEGKVQLFEDGTDTDDVFTSPLDTEPAERLEAMEAVVQSISELHPGQFDIEPPQD